MLFHKIASTSLGIGYIGKGAGTAAAAVTCLVWYYIGVGGTGNFNAALVVTVAIIALGIWSGNVVESIWGKDHNRVVIDEVAGMCITLLWVPVTPMNILLGFVLFRVFDIGKPLFIRRLEKLPGGWGVMFDDILAGVYANLILQLFLRFNSN
ncbi:MAG: phosphatidylglycerophosphatase [Pedobacter sp.]|jgi:phosphatidylglycerophosphatase A|nr:phosphatidylglycerophosphatase [Pedobacter sp.]